MSELRWYTVPGPTVDLTDCPGSTNTYVILKIWTDTEEMLHVPPGWKKMSIVMWSNPAKSCLTCWREWQLRGDELYYEGCAMFQYASAITLEGVVTI